MDHVALHPDQLPGPPQPVDAVLAELVVALDASGTVVVDAPPGAGKTTRVPLALLARDRPGRIVVLEPRRVAARAAAERLAWQLGEPVGARIGLATRDDRRRSADTRVEVVTEGVLLRRLQSDPSLEGVATVVLDEFHERSLEADLALAFALESRGALRPDLELVVASATLEVERVAALLGGAPVIRATSRRFDVEVEHRDRPPPRGLVDAVGDAVRDLLATEAGDVLVFLPGAAEIRRVAQSLGQPEGVVVHPLHGSLPPEAQDRALRPAVAGTRKVVLATDLAESSITIDGVRAVVDAGLSREPRFDATSGLSGLVTVPASQASAEQRAGRAGRTAPGRCIRLWPAREHGARDAASRPAIVTDDLTGAALEVATWGAEVAELQLLDQPPAPAWEAARRALAELGALDGDGRPTGQGRLLSRLPLHPRLGTLLLTGRRTGRRQLGAELAALLSDRDVLVTADRPGTDLTTRLQVLRGGRAPAGLRVRRGALTAARRQRDRLLRVLDRAPTGPEGTGAREATADEDAPEAVGALVLAAWPDQLAQRRAGQRGSFLLAGGRGATVDDDDPLAAADLLAVAHLDRGAREARIHLAAVVDERDVREVLGDRLATTREVAWRDGDVVSEERSHLGAVVLSRRPLAGDADGDRLAALLDGLRREGLDLLAVGEDDRELQARAALVREHLHHDWPALDDEALLASLEEHVAPFLLNVRGRADLARQQLAPMLDAVLGPQRRRELDRLAPTHLDVPSGSRRRVRYDGDGPPVLAVRLQELFGARTTPRVLDGRVAVVLHLLSPAGRPVQVTEDLAGFWERAYPEVRAELRGRYPKHAWPEDPTTATPLRGTPRRRS